jgi:beta-lactamase class A
MATVFQEIEKGNLDPEKRISYEIPEINERFDIATESAELTEGTFNMSVKNALIQMITISHNYAALSLTLEVGLSNVSQFLKNYGFANSSTKSPPQTTALDVMRFYEKLYAGELAGPEYTSQMITLLKRQQLNDRIPKYLPDGVEVAHKTGELGFVKHDAGIVYSRRGDYILVMMSETSSPKAAAERMALLSKDIYEYFESK